MKETKTKQFANGRKDMRSILWRRVGALATLSACLIVGILFVPRAVFAQAQERGQTPADLAVQPPAETSGVAFEGYQVQQSIELGYRYASQSGSPETYNTFVNLHSGPRILNQSLAMRSDNNSGLLFDTLYMNSFGWGGDPNNALRLDVSKNRWYNLNFNFRRDQNYWDYNLLANPLNSATSLPGVPVTFSPHMMETRRRMYDFDMRLLPQSKVSFRFGISRNRNEGPSLMSYHVGTEALLFQPWDTTSNTYRIGIDYHLLKKTSVSFDFAYESATNATDQSLAPFAVFPLANGTPVSLGVSSGPCTAPVNAAGIANPTCNAFLNYSQTQNFRTSIPQESISFQSTSIRRLDLTGRYSYSHAHADTPYNELLNGRESRTNLQQSTTTGSASTRWDTDTLELAATYSLTRHLRIVDQFRFYNYHLPGAFNSLQNSYFGTSMLLPVGSVPPFPHTTSSEADIAPFQYLWFQGQNEKTNTTQLQYDFSKRLGGSIGYRYRHRVEDNNFANFAVPGPSGNGEVFYPTNALRGDCAGGTPNPDGSCYFTGQFDGEDDQFTISQHTALFAIWARPTDKLRANYDMELSSLGSYLTSASGGFVDARSFLTRITPTNEQRYRARVSYLPAPWLTIAANFSDQESRNSFADIAYRQHNRNFGFDITAMPSGPVGVDLAYNYNGYLQNANICFVETPATAVPVATVPCSDGSGYLEANGYYSNKDNFGSAMLMLKPMKRVSANLGYSIVSVSGNTLTLNPLQPLGSLSYNYHQPVGNFSVMLTKNFTWNTAYNFYQYGERDIPGPPGYRNFHANLMTTSVTIAF